MKTEYLNTAQNFFILKEYCRQMGSSALACQIVQRFFSFERKQDKREVVLEKESKAAGIKKLLRVRRINICMYMGK